MSINAGTQVAIFTHFYLYVDPVRSLLTIGTGLYLGESSPYKGDSARFS